MAKWKSNLNLTGVLSTDESDEATAKACRKILPLLHAHNEPKVPDYIIQGFQNILDKKGRFDCEAFNNVLNVLYDWADDERVWVGTC